MGLLSDILKAIGVLFFGLKDHGKAYAEAVESAERYLRWGQERNDIRDYQSSLDCCQKCRDADAPKNELKLRRYSIQADALCGLIKCETKLFQDRNGKTFEKKKALIAEIEDLKNRTEEQKLYIKDLQLEGSLIKAKEAQMRLDETERHLERQSDVLNGGAIDLELQQEFSNLENVCNRHRSDLDVCIGAINAIDDIEQRLLDEIVERLRIEIPLLMDAVYQQAPENN